MEIIENVRVIPYHTGGGKDDGPEPRVETGPVRFGRDWPGLFVRGDDAVYLARCIGAVTDAIKNGTAPPPFALEYLASAVRTIYSEVVVSAPAKPE